MEIYGHDYKIEEKGYSPAVDWTLFGLFLALLGGYGLYLIKKIRSSLMNDPYSDFYRLSLLGVQVLLVVV